MDLRMYVVTSGTGRETVDRAARAAAAGAGMVQVRAKQATTRELLELTVAVARAVAQAAPQCRVVVDDRADVAWAARHDGEPVHGVHLGLDDLPPRAARELLGPDAIIGWTTGSLELVREARDLVGVVDYLGAGPFRPTPTKQITRPALGIDGYRPLVAASVLPIVAIGDVTPDDVAELAATGIAGVAMVRHVMQAEDPAVVVRRVLDAFGSPWQGVAPAR